MKVLETTATTERWEIVHRIRDVKKNPFHLATYSDAMDLMATIDAKGRAYADVALFAAPPRRSWRFDGFRRVMKAVKTRDDGLRVYFVTPE